MIQFRILYMFADLHKFHYILTLEQQIDYKHITQVETCIEWICETLIQFHFEWAESYRLCFPVEFKYSLTKERGINQKNALFNLFPCYESATCSRFYMKGQYFSCKMINLPPLSLKGAYFIMTECAYGSLYADESRMAMTRGTIPFAPVGYKNFVLCFLMIVLALYEISSILQIILFVCLCKKKTSHFQQCVRWYGVSIYCKLYQKGFVRFQSAIFIFTFFYFYDQILKY